MAGDNSAESLGKLYTSQQPLTFDPNETRKFIAENSDLKLHINGHDLHYHKVGNGPRAILLCPGSTGSIASDFLEQTKLEAIDHDKFCLVIYDRRGYGQSTPQDRHVFDDEMWRVDAKDAVELMKALGFPKFAFAGFCSGANVGIVTAALYPKTITHLFVWGAYPVITEKICIQMKILEYVNDWSKITYDLKHWEYPDMDYVAEVFRKLTEYIEKVLEERNGDLLIGMLNKIKCPVFVVDLKDDFLLEEAQIEAMRLNVENVIIHVEEKGRHSFQRSTPARFRALLESFILNS